MVENRVSKTRTIPVFSVFVFVFLSCFLLLVSCFLIRIVPVFAATTDGVVEWDMVWHSPSTQVEDHTYSYRARTQNENEANVDNDDAPYFYLKTAQYDLNNAYIANNLNGWNYEAMEWDSNHYDDYWQAWADMWRCQPGSTQNLPPGYIVYYNFKLVDGADDDYYGSTGMKENSAEVSNFEYLVEGISAQPTAIRRGSQTATISVWVTNNGEKVVDATVYFSCSIGQLSSNQAVTNASGCAQVTFSSSVSGNAIIGCTTAAAANYLGDCSDTTVTVSVADFIIDGSASDWSGTAPTTINTDTVSLGEYIWYEGLSADNRVDVSNYDSSTNLVEFRTTADTYTLYYLFKLQDLNDTSDVYVGIAIDTDLANNSGQFWLANDIEGCVRDLGNDLGSPWTRKDSSWDMDGTADGQRVQWEDGTNWPNELNIDYDTTTKQVYVGTNCNENEDVFILIGDSRSSGQEAPPWAKNAAHTVMSDWDARWCASCDNDNYWEWRTDGGTDPNDGDGESGYNNDGLWLEAYMDWDANWAAPTTLYISAVAYGTLDGGNLYGKTPDASSDGDNDTITDQYEFLWIDCNADAADSECSRWEINFVQSFTYTRAYNQTWTDVGGVTGYINAYNDCVEQKIEVNKLGITFPKTLRYTVYVADRDAGGGPADKYGCDIIDCITEYGYTWDEVGDTSFGMRSDDNMWGDVDYYFDVNYNKNGSVNTRPAPPTLVSPINRTRVVGTNPLLIWDWNDIDGGLASCQTARLSIDVDADQNFGSPDWSVSDANWYDDDTTVSTALTRGVTYYWRVKVKDDFEWSVWSSTDSFVINQLPYATNLLVNGQEYPMTLGDTTPMFSWTFNDADTDNQDSFYIQLDNTDGSFPSPEWNDTEALSDTYHVYHGPTLGVGIYWWRIKFHDGYEWGEWSAADSFTIVLSNIGRHPVISQTYPDPLTNESGGEFTEFYNPTPVDYNIGNWDLYDGSAGIIEFTIPANTILKAYSYYLVADADWETQKDSAGWVTADLLDDMTLAATDDGSMFRNSSDIAIDSLGWGTPGAGDGYEGTPASNDKDRYIRLSYSDTYVNESGHGQDSNNNSSDFTFVSNTNTTFSPPKNSASDMDFPPGQEYPVITSTIKHDGDKTITSAENVVFEVNYSDSNGWADLDELVLQIDNGDSDVQLVFKFGARLAYSSTFGDSSGQINGNGTLSGCSFSITGVNGYVDTPIYWRAKATNIVQDSFTLGILTLTCTISFTDSWREVTNSIDYHVFCDDLAGNVSITYDSNANDSFVVITGGNNAPAVTIDTSPLDGDTYYGAVQIVFTLTDTDNDNCTAIIEYSDDSGVTWKGVHLIQTTETTNLTVSSNGTQYYVIWDLLAEFGFGATQNDIKLRITPRDSNGDTGTVDTTQAFTVANLLLRNIKINEVAMDEPVTDWFELYNKGSDSIT
ncbi:MAG: lamin tail domain-containing protein, partial [Candidatus Hydrogenedentota bacterium]